MRVWRTLYPVGIHFLGIQISLNLFSLLVLYFGGGLENFTDYLLPVNLAGTLLSVPVTFWLFTRDQEKRGYFPGYRIKGFPVKEGILVFFMGMAVAFVLNYILNVLQMFRLFPAYEETMDAISQGQPFLSLFLWSCVAAPLSEELVFRWLIYKRLRDWISPWKAAVISAVIFGIYHGNILQFLYATAAGLIMAWVIEWTGSVYSSLILHAGANIWSSVLSNFGENILNSPVSIAFYLLTELCLTILLIYGLHYFITRYQRRNRI